MAAAESTSTTKSGSTSYIPITDANHPARKFVAEAESHVGSGGHSWVQSMTGIGNLAWCAATMCAVAKACGFDGKNMPGDRFIASEFGTVVVQEYGGTRIDGPMQGDTNATPQVGDFVIYQDSGTDKWGGYHIGVVRYCEGDVIYTVEGNTTGGSYSLREKTKSGSNIGWYARPDWTKVGGEATVSTGSALFTANAGSGGSLYSTQSTNADASIREVCYSTATGEPSISVTDTKLSVINYTNLLSSIVSMFGGTSSSSGSPDNIDALESTPKEIVSFLTGKGLCTAAGIGVIGNIKAESGFDTGAIGDNGTSFGICQWHNDRGTAMKQTAGTNWATNLSGQLEYLWHELTTSYNQTVLIPLQNVSNTLEGAKSAAETWCRKFEIPADVENEVVKRKNNAEEYWNMIVVVSTTNTGTTSTNATAQTTVANQSGNKISQGTSTKVNVSQTGIIANYTYYDRNWASGSIQRKLYDLWVAEGKPASHNVATLNGYYLVALGSAYATTGDMVSIVLEDGTYFNAILGDAKGADAGSSYGHNFGTSTNPSYDIVEWESATQDQNALRSGLSEAGWLNKKVDRIVNYGSYLTGSIT